MKKNVLKNLGLAAGTVAFFLVVFEVGLRLSGFSFVLYPEEIEFGKPDPVLMKTGFVEDDDLFWVTKDYTEKLRRYIAEPPPVLFLGDSCTHLGRYDLALAARVQERRGAPLVYGNLGVAGWSSYQGRRQMERDVVRIRPRVATIYFGWNDHWIGFGIEDRNVARVKNIFRSRFSGLRLVQLFTKATVAIGTRQTAYPNRVALDDFRANLHAMAETAKGAGIDPVFLTAPTSIRPGEEPDYLDSRWLRELSDFVPMHDAYAEAVREVATDEHVALCDLKERFSKLQLSEVETSFRADGIHLTAEGDARIAAMLERCLEDAGLWDAALSGPGK